MSNRNFVKMLLGTTAVSLFATLAHATTAADDDVVLLPLDALHSVAATGNFPAGYCTYYADQMIRQHWGGFKKGTTWQGDARNWLANAQAKGLKTSSTPSKNAIAVYGPTKTNSYGHVAYVTDINKKAGTYTVSEMNFKGFNKVSSRTLGNGAGGIIGFINPPKK